MFSSFRMYENTTFDGLEALKLEQATTETYEEITNISQQIINITDLADYQHTQSTLLNAGVITISSISLTCCLTALQIVTKCQRLPVPIKYLSKNFIVCFMMIDFTIWIHSVALLCWGDVYYHLIFDSRILFCTLSIAVLWGSLVAVTYERLLALVKPFKYVKYTTKNKLMFLISLVWIVNVLVPTSLFVVNAIRFCKFDNMYSCDVYSLYAPIKIALVCLMVIYILSVIAAYTKILSIIYKHQKNIKEALANKNFIATFGSNLKSTKTVAAIIFAFFILQAPVFFHAIIFEIRPELKQQNWRIILQAMDYVGYQLNLYATLYLYIWKFKECKMNFYLLFSKCSKRFKQTANDMRIEVYDIVTLERNSDTVTKQSSV